MNPLSNRQEIVVGRIPSAGAARVTARRWRRLAAQTWLILAFTVTVTAQVEYTITDLGEPPEGAYNVIPTGLNNLGEVVGWSYTSFASPPYRAWKWTPSEGLVVLPVPPPNSSGSYAASDINDSGVIAGGSVSNYGGPAWRFENGAYTFVGLLSGNTWAMITGLNNAGDVVGYSDNFSPGGNTDDHFLGGPGNGMVQIAQNAGNNIGRINDLQQVAGGGGLGGNAIIWSPDAGVTTLGDPPGFSCTFATAINNVGQVAGRASGTCSQSSERVAWLYSESDGWEIIVNIALPGEGGNRNEIPLAISNTGVVVGFSDVPPERAWVWSADRGARVLRDVIDDSALPSFFALHRAVDVNDAGQIVATGTSLSGGLHGAFLLTPVLVPGDINGDGVVDMNDVPAFTGVLLGADTDPARMSAADVNSDGQTNGLDVAPWINAMMSP